jgi:hypothetical protein
MRELGQFLAGPGSMLNCPSPWLAVGLIALCVTLFLSVVLLLRPLARDVSALRIMLFIPLVALVSVLAVILFQAEAQSVYNQGSRGFNPHNPYTWVFWVFSNILNHPAQFSCKDFCGKLYSGNKKWEFL